MSASIAIQVQRAFFEFEGQMGRKPTKLLLGQREQRWLNEHVKMLHPLKQAAHHKARPAFYGLEVYFVDDAEFLGVA